jgi:hypothetical protein
MLNKSEMVIITSGTKPPLAAPCIVRHTINDSMLLASAQKIELATNSASAANMIGLRPQISDNFAQIGPAAAFASR